MSAPATEQVAPPVLAPAEYVDRAIAILHWIEASDDSRA